MKSRLTWNKLKEKIRYLIKTTQFQNKRMQVLIKYNSRLHRLHTGKSKFMI